LKIEDVPLTGLNFSPEDTIRISMSIKAKEIDFLKIINGIRKSTLGGHGLLVTVVDFH